MSATRTVRRAWPATASTVPAARRMVRSELQSSGRPGLVDNAELIVSELVGNVVLHVGGDVEVSVVLEPEAVVLEVTDGSPLSPHLRVFSRTSSTGRGMRLVHSLSAEHGVRTYDHGKTIWVRLTATSASRGDDDVAESFADVDWLAELSDVDRSGEQLHVLGGAAA